MISLVFIFLAGICGAVMDTLVHHYSLSVFKNLNRAWWWPEVSWRNKYTKGLPELGRNKTPVWFSDAWHLFKSLMITFFILAVVFYQPLIIVEGFWNIAANFVALGVFYVTAFNLFYNHLLLKSK